MAAIFLFFNFPVLGIEARAVDGHPDNCSVVSPVPIHLVSFNVRTCRLLWYPMRKSCMVEPLWRAPKAVGHSWISSKCISGIMMSEHPMGLASLGPVGTLTEGPQQQVRTVTVSEGPSQRQEAETKQLDTACHLGWGARGHAWK